jgi:hypothetical protein
MQLPIMVASSGLQAAAITILCCCLPPGIIRCCCLPPPPQDAIDNFVGSVLIVSHDRWFLDRIATHILAFEGDSKVTWFEGSYSDYEQARKSQVGAIDPTRMKFRKLATV